MREISVLGLGYIGLPTASILATNGFTVHGVDVSQPVVDIINKGGIHIEEPGLKTLVLHERRQVHGGVEDQVHVAQASGHGQGFGQRRGGDRGRFSARIPEDAGGDGGKREGLEPFFLR